ncbi:hypothetical protein MITS9509_01993 [Synechococcus sp. MIT S9509]|nr:hypothetical protein MITS9509_01993 [Synechococcus sp. MIT S9509]
MDVLSISFLTAVSALLKIYAKFGDFITSLYCCFSLDASDFENSTDAKNLFVTSTTPDSRHANSKNPHSTPQVIFERC